MERDIKMNTRRRSFNKKNAKRAFLTKASDNRTAQIHVTGVYIIYALTSYEVINCNSIHVLRQSGKISSTKKI